MTAIKLRAEPDYLAALVDAAAKGRGLPQAFVEKDLWVIEVLRAATAHRTVETGRRGAAHMSDDTERWHNDRWMRRGNE